VVCRGWSRGGAASGLGKADAAALVQEGAKVVITDINEQAGRELERALNAMTPGSAFFLAQDVSSESRWQEVFAEIRRRFGGLHIMVNNAGMVVIGTPESATLEQFHAHLRVMTDSVFLACKYGIGLMKDSGGGSIINMCSTATHLGYPVFYAYTAAKGAVRSMTKAIAVHCQMNHYNVRCNSIHAGAIDTPMVVKATQELGYPESAIVGIGVVLLVCTLLYLFPRTSILGAILLTGYLGGALASQVRVQASWFNVVFAFVFACVVWGGLWLRDPRVRQFLR